MNSSEQLTGAEGEATPQHLSEIPVIQKSNYEPIRTKADIESMVEIPLVEACQILSDKNIRTVASSANAKDVAVGHVFILIGRTSLSETNHKIAQHLSGKTGPGDKEQYFLSLLVNQNSTVEEIRQASVRMPEAFQPQSMDWVPYYPMEQMEEWFGGPVDPIEAAQQFDLYYVPEERGFDLSEEHYHKSHERSEPK